MAIMSVCEKCGCETMDYCCPGCTGSELDDLRQRAETAEAELARLKLDYPGGDRDAQAMAWVAVWRALEDVGLLSFLEPEGTGRARAVAFIKHMAAEQDRLKAELAAMRETNKDAYP